MKNPLPESTTPGVLFVGIECADLPDAVKDHLRTRGDSAEYVDDVYRAMARIGRRAPAAVVVAVDWLSTEELKFFEILGRSYPDIAVYALGADRARPKVDRAAGDGATILATLGDLTELRRLTGDDTLSPPTPNTPNEPDPGFSRSKGDSENQDPLALAGNVFDAGLDERLRVGLEDVASPYDDIDIDIDIDLDVEDRSNGTDTADGEIAADGENSSDSARVPWLPHVAGPQRVPPSRVSSGAGMPLVRAEMPNLEPPSQTAWEDEDDPPLLSDEEMRALLGDDATFDRDR